VGALLVATMAAAAQAAPAAPLSFEVASIKPSAPDQANSVAVGLHIDGAQVHALDFSLKDYIRIAYKLKYYQVQTPDWAASARFDLDAKLPDGATADQVPEMLQTFLAQRFGLVSHTEMKPTGVYALEQTPGGAHLKVSTVAGPPPAPKGAVSVAASGSERGVAIALPGGAYFGLSLEKGLEATHITMPVFADSLGRFVSKPVVDATHLEGVYDLDLPLQREDYQALLIQSAIAAGVNLPPRVLSMAAGSDSALNTALAPEGLRLHPTTAPVEFRIVDKLAKTPSDN